MLGICLALALQSPPAAQAVELPVSLDRVRSGLTRSGLFDPPKPRPWRGLVFRMKVEKDDVLAAAPWAETWMVPNYVRPTSSPTHFQFLQTTAPAKTRSSSLGIGLDVIPALYAAKRYIDRRIYAAKEARAKKEVAEAMRAAGIPK